MPSDLRAGSLAVFAIVRDADTVLWTRGKVKIAYGRRRSSVNALVSDAAPGVALQEGKWIDFERDKDKQQLDTAVGWRAVAINSGVAIGPVLYDRDRRADHRGDDDVMRCAKCHYMRAYAEGEP